MAMVRVPLRDEVWLVALNPTRGTKIPKTRPCLVVSTDERNAHLQTVIVAPMTTVKRAYPTRVDVLFQGKRGQVAVDQLRAVDRQRLVQRLGTAPTKATHAVFHVLAQLFARP